MPDTRVYTASDEVQATMTLESHEAPQQIWLYLSLAPTTSAGGLTPMPSPDRQTSFALSTSPFMGGTPSLVDGKYQLKGTVPHQIVGGTYKATYAIFQLPSGNRTMQNPDPDGDFLRQIADDPPSSHDTPIIKDLD